MMKSFAGKLTCFDRKTDDDLVDDKVVVELVDNENGYVELMFPDRNERTYIRFRLEDLMRAVMYKEPE